MKKKTYPDFFTIITLSMIIFTLIFPWKTASYCKDALVLCGESLIPSIFTFTVLAKILTHFSACGMFSKKIENFFSRLFNLPPSLIPSCILGLFCSSPSGAVAAACVYEKKLCTKEQAERASVISDNCSAAFIISIGSMVTGSYFLSLLLFISELLSALIVYFFLFRGKKEEFINPHFHSEKQSSISRILCESITSTADIAIRICAYVLFFSTTGKIITDCIAYFLNDNGLSTILRGLTLSFFEMTSGINYLKWLGGYEAVIILSSAISFCGLSVMFQVTDVLNEKGLSSRLFVLSRLYTALLSPLLTLFFLLILPENVAIMTSNVTYKSSGITVGDIISLLTVTLLFIIGGIFIAFLDKKHKK